MQLSIAQNVIYKFGVLFCFINPVKQQFAFCYTLPHFCSSSRAFCLGVFSIFFSSSLWWVIYKRAMFASGSKMFHKLGHSSISICFIQGAIVIGFRFRVLVFTRTYSHWPLARCGNVCLAISRFFWFIDIPSDCSWAVFAQQFKINQKGKHSDRWVKALIVQRVNCIALFCNLFKISYI